MIMTFFRYDLVSGRKDIDIKDVDLSSCFSFHSRSAIMMADQIQFIDVDGRIKTLKSREP